MIMGTWIVNRGPCSVIRGPWNVIMGPWIEIMGPRNVKRRRWNVNRDRGI